MNQEAYMELCPTLDMIGDYFAKAIQGSQFCCFCNIILGIQEYDIPSYNESGIEILEEWNIEIDKDK